MSLNKGDHVECSRLGAGEFVILAIYPAHYTVKSINTGEKHEIYQALCHVPVKLAFANRDRRKARAENIGRPKRFC